MSYQTLVKFCFQDKIFEYIINHLQFGIKIAVHLRGEFGIKHGIAECRGYSWGLSMPAVSNSICDQAKQVGQAGYPNCG